MAKDRDREPPPARAAESNATSLPKPTTAFRRRAWLQFQRAIDPLAPPKPLKISRH